MVPTAEAVRFANTGSEATMLALRLARAHTGRTKFLKFEGHYHGWYDLYCLNGHSHPIGQVGPSANPTKFPDSEGIPPSVFEDVVLAPWNDIESLERILRTHGNELAAIITEPIMANMGCILPRDGYLQRVSGLAHQYGALFILDEVVTGFRYAPGAARVLRPETRPQHIRQSTSAQAFQSAPSPDLAPSSTACAGATIWFCTTARSTDIASQ